MIQNKGIQNIYEYQLNDKTGFGRAPKPPDSQEAPAKGHKVFLCSGRNYAMLSPLLHYGFDGVVASAGGYVTVGSEVIYDHPMTADQAKTALDSLHAEGVFCTVETKGATYGDEDLGSFLADNAGAKGNSEIERWRKALAESLNIRPMSNLTAQILL